MKRRLEQGSCITGETESQVNLTGEFMDRFQGSRRSVGKSPGFFQSDCLSQKFQCLLLGRETIRSQSFEQQLFCLFGFEQRGDLGIDDLESGVARAV